GATTLQQSARIFVTDGIAQARYVLKQPVGFDDGPAEGFRSSALFLQKPQKLPGQGRTRMALYIRQGFFPVGLVERARLLLGGFARQTMPQGSEIVQALQEPFAIGSPSA